MNECSGEPACYLLSPRSETKCGHIISMVNGSVIGVTPIFPITDPALGMCIVTTVTSAVWSCSSGVYCVMCNVYCVMLCVVCCVMWSWAAVVIVQRVFTPLYPGIHTIVYLLTIVFIWLCAGPGVGANDFRCPEEFGYYQVIVEIFLE